MGAAPQITAYLSLTVPVGMSIKGRDCMATRVMDDMFTASDTPSLFLASCTSAIRRIPDVYGGSAPSTDGVHARLRSAISLGRCSAQAQSSWLLFLECDGGGDIGTWHVQGARRVNSATAHRTRREILKFYASTHTPPLLSSPLPKKEELMMPWLNCCVHPQRVAPKGLSLALRSTWSLWQAANSKSGSFCLEYLLIRY